MFDWSPSITYNLLPTAYCLLPTALRPTAFFIFLIKFLMKGYRSMSLKERNVSDMTAAMKSKDAARLSALRMVKASVMNREIEKGGELSDEEMTKALQSLVKQRRDSIEQYEKAGRQELADKERAEIEVIESYLPQAATREEIERAVAEAIKETNASSMRYMGVVMKAAQGRLAGRSADGRTVSEIVKAKLGEAK
jgi:uncharacterized protein YqeY